MIRKIFLFFALFGGIGLCFAATFQQQLQQTALRSAASGLQRHWKPIAGGTLAAVSLFGLASYGYISGYGLNKEAKNPWNEALTNRLSQLSYAQRITGLLSLLKLRYKFQKKQEYEPDLNLWFNDRTWPDLPLLPVEPTDPHHQPGLPNGASSSSNPLIQQQPDLSVRASSSSSSSSRMMHPSDQPDLPADPTEKEKEEEEIIITYNELSDAQKVFYVWLTKNITDKKQRLSHIKITKNMTDEQIEEIRLNIPENNRPDEQWN